MQNIMILPILVVVLTFTQSAFARKMILGVDGNWHPQTTTDIMPLPICGGASICDFEVVKNDSLTCFEEKSGSKKKLEGYCLITVQERNPANRNNAIYRVIGRKKYCDYKQGSIVKNGLKIVECGSESSNRCSVSKNLELENANQIACAQFRNFQIYIFAGK